MAELLYRLGRSSARHAWRVVAAWLVVLLAALAAYLLAGGTLTNEITIPGTATDQATAKLQKALPSASGGSGTVVFHTTDGSTISATQQQEISAALVKAGKLDGVKSIMDPFTVEAQRTEQAQQIAQSRAQLDAAMAAAQAGIADPSQAPGQGSAGGDPAAAQQELAAQSAQLDYAQAMLDLTSGLHTVSEDGSAAVASATFDADTYSVPDSVKTALQDTLNAATPQGVQVDYSAAIAESISGLVGPSEGIGVIIAGVVLLIMLGTLIAAGLPILTALIGVGIGALFTLSFSGVVDMISITPILGVMLGLAVGIDYSLFIVNRHRTNLTHGMPMERSIALATGTSGNAVVFAGATVLIALLGLNLTGIPFLGLIGTVGAASILVAVLIAITLTPALLSLIGRRVFSKRAWIAIDAGESAPAPVRVMSTPRAAIGAVGAVLALLVVAAPVLSMRLNLPDGSAEPLNSTQYRAYTTVRDTFGAGVNGPLVVIANFPAGTSAEAAAALELKVGQQLDKHQDVVAVAPIGLAKDNTLAAYQVIPADGPTSQSTEDLVRDLRELAPDKGVTLQVAGQASGNIDISEKLAAALPIYLLVVVGLSFIILVLVFRSLLVPLIATGGFILTVFAALGGVTATYQWGWLSFLTGVHDPGPVLNFLPIILVGVLFGLAMDYQLFITTGMREARVLGSSARLAVQEGKRAGRVVVTAAAIIMISVFGSFMFSDTAAIRPAGFGLAFGILIDAFVVRMFLVPRLMHLAGEKAWWIPRWLDRVLPNVDIEGAALERHHGGAPATAEAAGERAGAPVEQAARS